MRTPMASRFWDCPTINHPRWGGTTAFSGMGPGTWTTALTTLASPATSPSSVTGVELAARSSVFSGAPQRVTFLGLPDDQPIVLGGYNGVFRNGTWYMDNGTYYFGLPGDIAVVGEAKVVSAVVHV